jgi:hypothetical protein
MLPPHLHCDKLFRASAALSNRVCPNLYLEEHYHSSTYSDVFSGRRTVRHFANTLFTMSTCVFYYTLASSTTDARDEILLGTLEKRNAEIAVG